MAYAAITHTSRRRVRATIDALCHVEAAAEKAPDAPIFSALDDPFLFDLTWAIFGKAARAFADNPKLTVETVREVRFDLIGELDGAPVRTEQTGRVTHLPRHTCVSANGYAVTPSITVDVNTHPYFQARVRRDRAVAEIHARWRLVADNVDDFLEDCKSFNEALKLWPGLSRYMDREDLAKVKQKVEKPKREPTAAMAALAAMDMAVIAQSNVLARLAGAANTTNDADQEAA